MRQVCRTRQNRMELRTSYSVDRLWPANLRMLSLIFFALLHAIIMAIGLVPNSKAPVSLGRIEITANLQGIATSDQTNGAGNAPEMATSAKEITQTNNRETLLSDTDHLADREPPSESREATPYPANIRTPIPPPPDINANEIVQEPTPKSSTKLPVPKRERPVKIQKSKRDTSQRPISRPRNPTRDEGRKAVRAAGGQGTATGSSQSGGRSRTSYAALVVAQIQAHKYYPPAARGQRISGVVAFTFAIGPSGTVSRFNMTRSSGSAVLDQAARQIVFSIRPPPPPGGSFIGASSLRFDMTR